MACDKWWSGLWDKESKLSLEILDTIENLGVKMIALDMDFTTLDFKITIDYDGSMEELASHIRPCFKYLIATALRNGHPRICIVSYNITSRLIKRLLKFAFPHCDTSKILIQENPDITVNYKFRHFFTKLLRGKERHLDLIKEKYEMLYGHKLKAEEIILFDDDVVQYRKAKSSGHYSFLVRKDVTSMDILTHIKAM